MKDADYYTEFDIVTKVNGQIKYITLEELSDMPHDAKIAKVRVIKDRKTGKERSRDQVIHDDQWITVKEYYTQN